MAVSNLCRFIYNMFACFILIPLDPVLYLAFLRHLFINLYHVMDNCFSFSQPIYPLRTF